MITTKMNDAKTFLNERFKYVSDSEQYGISECWVRMGVADTMEGDCEDYAMAILDHIVGYKTFKFYKTLFTKEAKLHFLTVNGVGHCMLEYNGFFIDNNYRTWVRKDQITSKYVFKKRYNLFVIGSKMIVSKVRRFFKKIT